MWLGGRMRRRAGGGLGPAPVLTSLNPNTATTTGGTSMQCIGSAIVSGAQVEVAGTLYAGTYIGAARVDLAAVPAHAAGGVSVRIKNPDGQFSNALTLTYATALLDPATLALSVYADTIGYGSTWADLIGKASAGDSDLRRLFKLAGTAPTIGTDADGCEYIQCMSDGDLALALNSAPTADRPQSDALANTGAFVEIVAAIPYPAFVHQAAGAGDDRAYLQQVFGPRYNGSAAINFGPSIIAAQGAGGTVDLWLVTGNLSAASAAVWGSGPAAYNEVFIGNVAANTKCILQLEDNPATPVFRARLNMGSWLSIPCTNDPGPNWLIQSMRVSSNGASNFGPYLGLKLYEVLAARSAISDANKDALRTRAYDASVWKIP